MTGSNCDLQSYLSVQPKNRCIPASQAAKNLASELLILLDYDESKAQAILGELVRQNPCKTLEWYYETAITNQLKKQRS